MKFDGIMRSHQGSTIIPTSGVRHGRKTSTSWTYQLSGSSEFWLLYFLAIHADNIPQDYYQLANPFVDDIYSHVSFDRVLWEAHIVNREVARLNVCGRD